MVYESFVVAAILFIATLLFHGAAIERLTGAMRVILQVYLVTVLGLYFVWFWQRGQTLPMKAWRLRLTARDGSKVSPARALARYFVAAFTIGTSFAAALYLREHRDSVAAWLALVPGPLSIGWAIGDPDRQCLYDRVAGTRLIRSDSPPAHRERG
jgi:uncharacterized RDD family membrane protein YckC